MDFLGGALPNIMFIVGIIAIGAGLPLLDLRLICNSLTDYANPIEPSAAGGAKIAKVITRVVTQHDFAQPRTTVFVE